MGEVVDLEIYRKRLKRGAACGPGPGGRRSPNTESRDAKPSGKTGKPKRRGTVDKSKIESKDSTSD